MPNLLVYMTPIGMLVFLTFFIGAFYLNFRNKIHCLLLAILTISFLTESLSIFFLACHLNLKILYSISFIFHHLAWIWLLSTCTELKFRNTPGAVFICFSILNLLFMERAQLNHMTFIFGALLYISVFTYQSYCWLRTEQLSYFTSNTYLLLFAPVLFFFGFSFTFGFGESHGLKNTLIYGQTMLYDFISCFVNLIYYLLINLYIYFEQRKSDEY